MNARKPTSPTSETRRYLIAKEDMKAGDRMIETEYGVLIKERAPSDGPAPACWIWQDASIDRYGYARVWVRGIDRLMKAHRVIYEILVGPIAPTLTIDHLCRNRACVNPAHMEPVTVRENTLRGNGRTAKQARQTHCLRGHTFGHETRGGGKRRRCHECARANHAKRDAGRKR